MVAFYLVMCLHTASLQWHALTNKLHYTKQLCIFELMERAQFRQCRCEPYITLLDQRGDD